MAYWTAAQIYAQREHLALHALGLAGYEVYSPRIAERCIVRGRRVDVTRALFPTYAFILIVDHWWTAMRAPGVVRLVMDGARPARVPNSIIDGLHKRERGGVVELPSPPRPSRPGSRVRLVSGLFCGKVGTIALHRGLNGRERCEILLGALRVEVARAAIEVVA